MADKTYRTEVLDPANRSRIGDVRVRYEGGDRERVEIKHVGPDVGLKELPARFAKVWGHLKEEIRQREGLAD